MDVRIEGNVFERHGGRGAIGVLSSTVDIHVGAVIARNRIFEQSGEEAGLLVDLPTSGENDYCIRIENNVIVDNEVGIDFFYAVFDDQGDQFELVNNTVVGNRHGLMMAGPWGPHLLVNAQCLLEPAASAGQISESESTLCAVRADGALSRRPPRVLLGPEHRVPAGVKARFAGESRRSAAGSRGSAAGSRGASGGSHG